MNPASCLATVAEPGVAAARNPGIDVLRGLAIVLVVFNHLGLRIPLKHTALADVLPSWLLVRLNYNGYEAVFVFFVISGFLIAGNALRRWGRLARIDARAFYGAALRPHRAVPAGAGGRIEHAGSGWRVRLHDHPREPVAAARHPRRAWAAPELVRGADGLSAGQLGRAVVAVDRGGVLPRLSAGVPADPATRGADTDVAVAVAGVVDAVDACRPARQRDLAGESLSAGYVGDCDRRAGCVARLALATSAAANDAPARHAWRAGAGGRDAGWRSAVGSAARRVSAGAGRLGAVSVAGLPAAAVARRMATDARLGLAALVGATELRNLSQPHVRGVRGGRLFRLVDGDPRRGFLWYVLALPLCWVLGKTVERWLSLPCERWLRASLLPHRIAQASNANPLRVAD